MNNDATSHWKEMLEAQGIEQKIIDAAMQTANDMNAKAAGNTVQLPETAPTVGFANHLMKEVDRDS